MLDSYGESMSVINEGEAERYHQVATKHERCANGEYRFRLRKSDGSGYIRTERPNHSGWQESHYHAFSTETYIVQAGWVAYARLNSNTPLIVIYRAGELFTVESLIIHNIYMSLNSVLHTVKHGSDVRPNDWVRDPEECLDNQTAGRLTTDEMVLTAAATFVRDNGHESQTYTEEYRHFDNIIWQIPAWCTAILAVAATGINAIPKIIQSTSTGLSSLSSQTTTLIFLLLLATFILVMSHVLYRLRWHQSPLKRYPKTPLLASAQFYLQFIVTLEFALVVFLFLRSLRLELPIAAALVSETTLFLAVYREIRIQRRRSKG